MREHGAQAPVEWGIARRCRRGEATSGDLGIVAVSSAGALVAGIDGLGHGGEAARAARTAADVIRDGAGHDLVRLIERCHVALAGTRGAAISLAFISAPEGGLTWLGVGNVEGRVLSADRSTMAPKGSLALAGGIPGHELPRLTPTGLGLGAGDVLLFATDGIEPAFADSLDISGSTQAISDRVLADFWKPSDDALVVAVRFRRVRP